MNLGALSSISFSSVMLAGTAVAGAVFSSQPVFSLVDAFSNAYTASSTVTVSFYTNNACTVAAGAIGSSGDSLTITTGSAPFTALKATKVGVYYIKASTLSKNSSCSTNSLSVTAGAASQISFSPILSSGTVAAGSPFLVQPSILLTDSYANPVQSASVLISFYNAASCTGTSLTNIGLSGNTTTSNANGVAAFSTLAATKVGTYYVQASYNSLSVCSSNTLAVTVGVLTLSYTVNVNTTVKQITYAVWPTQPSILVQDAYLNTVSGATITLTPFLTPSCLVNTGGTGVLSVTTATTASNGIAAFSGITYSYAEQIYLKATYGKNTFDIVFLTAHLYFILGSTSICSSAMVVESPSYSASWYAGSGTQGFQLGSPLSSAQFFFTAASPTNPLPAYGGAVFVDSSNNLFIMDPAILSGAGGTGNCMVRVIASGTTTAIVHAGPATANKNNAGTFVSPVSLSSSVKFQYPMNMDSDSLGNLYVTDSTNLRIVKLSAYGATTFAASYYAAKITTTGNLVDLAFDSSNNLYVTDSTALKIWKIASSTLAITKFAGTGTTGTTDGAAASAKFQQPWGIVIDSTNNIYVSDPTSNTIRKITTATPTVSTYAGLAGTAGVTNGQGTAARFSAPRGMAIDSRNNIYIVDSGVIANAVRRINSTGYVTTLSFYGTQPAFSTAGSVDIDSLGNLYLADLGTSRILKMIPCTSQGLLLN